ncbi:MAG: serine protease, partial [Lachnospiraceae bacterium]|nr:serine protease [Lachnospiraceae bacterium]
MEFIREKIKDKPINKKRILTQLGVAALCGLVFALVSCMIVVLFIPVFKTRLAEVDTEIDETEQNSEIDSETEVETENTPVILPDISLTISDYQDIQNQLYSIGNEANKSIVTVTSKISETDWMNNSYERVGQGAGVIISEDNQFLYILTERKNIADTKHINVTFINDVSAEAALLKYDAATGITILTVERKSLESETFKAIKT